MLTKTILALVFMSVGYIQAAPLRPAYTDRSIDLGPYTGPRVGYPVVLRREPRRFAPLRNKTGLSTRSDEIGGSENLPDLNEIREKISEDNDELLDEIDAVLEENAEEFVRGHVGTPKKLMKSKTIRSDIDDILDEIDDVLEENAEDFVRSYVQKGGQ